MHLDSVLIKQVRTIVTGRQNDAQMIKFPEPMLLGKPMVVLQATFPVAKRPPCVASAFLGRRASITMMDLTKQKKFGS